MAAFPDDFGRDYGGGGFGGGGGYFDYFDYYDSGNGFIDIRPPGGGGGGGGIPPIVIQPPIGGGGGGGVQPPNNNVQMTILVDDFERRLKANLASWQRREKNSATAVGDGWSIMDQMAIALSAYGPAGLKSLAERDRRVNPAMLRWDWILWYIDSITGGGTTLPTLPPQVSQPGPGGYIPNSDNQQIYWLLAAGVVLYLLSKK